MKQEEEEEEQKMEDDNLSMFNLKNEKWILVKEE